MSSLLSAITTNFHCFYRLGASYVSEKDIAIIVCYYNYFIFVAPEGPIIISREHEPVA